MLTTMIAVIPPHPAGSSFNADFYIAAATVIPVLFVAIVVGGPDSAFRHFTTRMNAAFRSSLQGLPPVSGLTITSVLRLELALIRHPRRLAALWLVSMLMNLTLLVLAAGTAGEILAFVALGTRHASAGVYIAVLASVISLTVIAAARPAGSLLYAYFRPIWQLLQEEQQAPGAPAPEGEPPAPVPSPEG
jgi:hypothetical protein